MEGLVTLLQDLPPSSPRFLITIWAAERWGGLFPCGFDIAGPGGFHAEHEAAAAFVPVLEHADETLRQRIGSIPGAQIERKRFAIAVHYRCV